MTTKYFLGLSAIFSALSLPSLEAHSQEFIDIAKGGNQICALTTANELNCTTNSFAERLEPPSSIPALTQIGVGDVHSCGLDFNGRAVCWGDNDYSQLNVPADVTFESIDVGWNHTCAITAGLETVCWGLPDNGRLEVPTDGLPFIAVDANFNHTCALEAAGGIRCWGSSSVRWDPPDSNADIVAFATTATYATPTICALMESGRIDCNSDAYQFPGIYTDVASWDRSMCALTTSGDLECQQAPEELQAEVAQINERAPLTKLTSHHALCVVDSSAQIACTSTINNGSTGGGQQALNDVPLPSGTDSTGFEPPSAVDDLRVSVYSVSTVELFWTAIRKGGDGRVVGAEIYRNGELLTRTDNFSSYLDTKLTADVDYTYEVRIVNSRGDVGPAGNTVTVNTGGDFVVNNYVRPPRPATPTDLVALDRGDSGVELLWGSATSNADVHGFEVYRNNNYLGFTQEEMFFDRTVTPSQNYHYHVLAVDENGNILDAASTAVDIN